MKNSTLDQLFFKARTHSHWENREIESTVLNDILKMTVMGPTSANCQPMRICFVKSQEAKLKLKLALAEGNIEKTMSAPVTAILAYDMKFHDQLPKWFPHTDAKSWFEGNDDLIAETAFRNGTLQAGYFILAARACGLDCGPMSGFDKKMVDDLFFKETSFKSNFLCNLGYGRSEQLFSRSPRPSFDDIAVIK